MSLLLAVSGAEIGNSEEVVGHYDPVTQTWSTFPNDLAFENAPPSLLTGSKTQCQGVDDDTST